VKTEATVRLLLARLIAVLEVVGETFVAAEAVLFDISFMGATFFEILPP